MIRRDAYDHNVAVVDGFAMPGKSTISGAAIETKWNEQDGHGQTGASISYTGTKLSAFVLTIEMWTDAHLAQWELVKKLFDPPKPGGLALGHAIEHPTLADVGIDKFVVTQRPAVTKGTTGRWSVAIQCKQYRKRLPALVKIRGAIPAAGAGAAAAAQTEADKALVEARAQAEAAKVAAQ